MKKTYKKKGNNWIVTFAIVLILFAVIGRENENNDKTSQIQRTQKSETEVGKTNGNVLEKGKSESDRTVESEQIQNDNSLNKCR